MISVQPWSSMIVIFLPIA